MPKSLASATALGALIGVALVWWTAPRTSSGVVFLIVACVILCNLLAGVGTWLAALFAKPHPGGTPRHE